MRLHKSSRGSVAGNRLRLSVRWQRGNRGDVLGEIVDHGMDPTEFTGLAPGRTGRSSEHRTPHRSSTTEVACASRFH